MALMVTQIVTVALRVREMGSRSAVANAILIPMSAIHTDARWFDRGAPNFQRMTPEERALGAGGLYRFYDANQRPLYFGISVSFEVRWDAHRLKAPWWPLAEFVALSFYSGRRAPLYSYETAAIWRERPPFNGKTQGPNRRRLAPPLPRFPEVGG